MRPRITGAILRVVRYKRHPDIPFEKSPNAAFTGANRCQFIILHGSGGSELGSESWILDPAAGVSYHYFIGKGDKSLADARQFVDDRDVAWHVGRSAWSETPSVPGQEPRRWRDMNHCSIGIGLESHNRADEYYPESQLRVARELVLWLMRQHNIPVQRVLTHRMVSDPIGRKIDPVNFPYEDFIRSLAGEQEDVTLRPRLQELEGLRLFVDNQPQGVVSAGRIVGDKLYLNRKKEES